MWILAKKRVLADHQKVHSQLVTPFNREMGDLHEVSWTKTMIPELLWIWLVQDVLGHHWGVEVINCLTRTIRRVRQHVRDPLFAAASNYALLTDDQRARIIDAGMTERWLDDIKTALRPLAANYPSSPVNVLYDDSPVREESDLDRLTQAVGRMFDRHDRDSMLVQATAIWIAFDSDRLKVAPHLALADFPKIGEYPDTPRSQEVAASIRASLNFFFGDVTVMGDTSVWPVSFWNRGLEISACKVMYD